MAQQNSANLSRVFMNKAWAFLVRKCGDGKSGALDKVNSDEMEVELVMVWQAQSLAFFSEMFSSSYMKLYTTSTNKRKMRIPQIKYEILNTSINQQKIRHGTSSKKITNQSEEQQGLISYFTIAS
ncbi:unnamed protein product [Rhizophagus irregularis]|nr:unnamed protein product [Rhizophagus irregularis]